MILNLKWLIPEQFKNAVDLLPLVSIDLCVIYIENKLLGNRNNRLAKNWWFTPSGRVKKSEPTEIAIQRIYLEEINYPSLSRD
jgi:colanic acid biosynthesis protein WcaH